MIMSSALKTIKWLDACPPEVIRKFINCSWQFTSAYWLGLTGWAADWAVKKYRSHHTISEQALRALEAAGRLKGLRYKNLAIHNLLWKIRENFVLDIF